MKTLQLSVWTSFQNFVNGWSDVTYYIVLAVLIAAALMAFVPFVKTSYGSNKKAKWGNLVFAIVCFAIMAILAAARWA